ncbi:MAG: S41 family peptidase [Bdellovibrionota bacterium]
MTKKKPFSISRTFILLFGGLVVMASLLYSTNPAIVSFATSLDLELPWKNNLELKRLDRVLYYIDESYFDPERINYQTMLKEALNMLSLQIPEMKVDYVSDHIAVIEISGQKKQIDTRIPKSSALYLKIKDCIPFIMKHREEKKEGVAELEEWAIHGILNTLDPHSNFLSKDVYNETRVGTSGKFGGLGIVIGIRDTKLTVISPLDDTPAAAAGIQASDIITKIENESTVGMTLTEAVDRMRGPKGTQVTIAVSRKGWKEPKNFTLTRADIKLVAVESALLPKSIGFIKIKSFQGNLSRDVRTHLDNLHASSPNGLKGLILDLRNNPGGLLDEAIKVSDIFLEEGTIVSTVGMQNRVRNVERARKPRTEPNYPMIVLVNEGSASASEIVAGALQRNGRALIYGKRTFGKGTVQSIYELPEDSAVKLTIAKYKTAGDVSIQSLGIVADMNIVPAIINKNEIVFEERKDDYGEASLERHFDNSDNPSISLTPLDDIHYLREEEETDDESSQKAQNQYQFSSLSNEEKTKHLFESFDVRFAHEILSYSTSSMRGKMISLTHKIGDQWKKLENKKIEKAFADLGIDWSPRTDNVKSAKECSQPEFAYKLSPEKKIYESGDKIHIQASIKNKGTCSLFQSKATMNSKNSIFDGLTFYFGKVGPGKSISKNLDVEVPNYVMTNLSKVDMAFSESMNIVPKTSSMWIPIQRKLNPKFVFNYDYKTEGDNVALQIHIKNIGDAALKDSYVTLTQTDDFKSLKFKTSRKTLSKLKPGEQETISFSIGLPEQKKTKYGVAVNIADLDYREYIRKEFEIDGNDQKGSKMFQSPSIDLSNANKLEKTKPSSKFVLEAKISDDRQVKDVYIVVNDHKVFYQKLNSHKSNEPQFVTANLPLDKESNEILIVARDDEDMSQTYGLLIDR